MPAYNVAPYVTEALHSIAAQTMRDLECVVVNDGSTDDTRDIVDEWLAATRDRRFDRYSTAHSGVAHALGIGLEFTHAPRVMFHAGDDTMSPDYLDRCLAAMDATGAPVAYTDVGEVGVGGVWSPRYGSVSLAEQNTIPGCAVVDRWVIEKAGGIPSGFPHGCEDWGLFVKAEHAGCFTPTPPVHVPGPIYYHTRRPGSLSSAIGPHMPEIRARIAAIARGEA
jgi:glycosyltransferase involved in cell wall biosynthesis